jgi:hypothetical protein
LLPRPSSRTSSARIVQRDEAADAAVDASKRARGERVPSRLARRTWCANRRPRALVLARGLALAGRVVDDTGAPLERFQIQAELLGAERSLAWGHLTSARRGFKSADGGLRLDSLRAGAWSVVASARGHARCEPRSTTAPGRARPRRPARKGCSGWSGSRLNICG